MLLLVVLSLPLAFCYLGLSQTSQGLSDILVIFKSLYLREKLGALTRGVILDGWVSCTRHIPCNPRGSSLASPRSMPLVQNHPGLQMPRLENAYVICEHRCPT